MHVLRQLHPHDGRWRLVHRVGHNVRDFLAVVTEVWASQQGAQSGMAVDHFSYLESPAVGVFGDQLMKISFCVPGGAIGTIPFPRHTGGEGLWKRVFAC